MANGTHITFYITDIMAICAFAIFLFYNFLVIQFAPEIKKWIKDKTIKKKEFKGLSQ